MYEFINSCVIETSKNYLVYLCIVLDKFSKMIVGKSPRKTQDVELKHSSREVSRSIRLSSVGFNRVEPYQNIIVIWKRWQLPHAMDFKFLPCHNLPYVERKLVCMYGYFWTRDMYLDMKRILPSPLFIGYNVTFDYYVLKMSSEKLQVSLVKYR